jgi:hypothetical protein
MLIAAINDQILYYIAVAAYGVFYWWNNRRNKAPGPDTGEIPPRQDTQNQPNPSPNPADSEQERLRRYLEALGLPSGQQTQPPRPAAPAPPRPLPQPAQPRPYVQPAPRQVQQPRTPAPRIYPPIRPVSRPVPVVREPESRESMDPGRLEESATAIENIGAELDKMSRDVRTMSSTDQAPAASPGAANALFTATQARTMIEIFRTPETLRTALLAQEILGPPRGLQS